MRGIHGKVSRTCLRETLHFVLYRGGVGHVIFALPWFITWYSHVLDDLDVILRLYDLFIVSDYLMPIYVAAEVGTFAKNRENYCLENDDLDCKLLW